MTGLVWDVNVSGGVFLLGLLNSGVYGQFIDVNPQTEIAVAVAVAVVVVVVVASAWPEPWVCDYELEFNAWLESLNKNL
ncbi:MAG: hypothetical protein JJ956_05865 [Pseudomonadales bacterium]|nr:hypothetical protein [Pseudomonadales bacterium]